MQIGQLQAINPLQDFSEERSWYSDLGVLEGDAAIVVDDLDAGLPEILSKLSAANALRARRRLISRLGYTLPF